MRRAIHRRKDDGFTLLELLVVIGIFSLVMVAIVSFSRPKPGHFALRVSAHDIAAQLRAARASTIRDNTDRVFTLDLTSRRFSSDVAKKAESLPDGTRVTMITAQSEIYSGNTAQIRFLPNGSATGGALVLQQNGRGYAVTTDWLTGQVRVEDYDGPIR